MTTGTEELVNKMRTYYSKGDSPLAMFKLLEYTKHLLPVSVDIIKLTQMIIVCFRRPLSDTRYLMELREEILREETQESILLIGLRELHLTLISYFNSSHTKPLSSLLSESDCVYLRIKREL